ncbi:MAG: hypothetical protein ACK5LZ_05740 [Anaerorhabdus sp.]
MSTRVGRGKSGSLAAYGLICILIVTMLFPIVVGIFTLFKSYDRMDQTAQDEIATYQLRRILVTGTEFEVDDRRVFFMDDAKKQELIIKNGHVYLSPGTRIFYSDIETGHFKVEERCLYVCYNRKGSEVCRVLVNV